MLRVIELIKVVLGFKYPPFAIAAEIMASHDLVFIPKHKNKSYRFLSILSKVIS